jgi:hypothetical protein
VCFFTQTLFGRLVYCGSPSGNSASNRNDWRFADVPSYFSLGRKTERHGSEAEATREPYNLVPKFDPEATMSRGKRLVVGPTATLADGMDWDALASLKLDEIRDGDAFPYKALPHPAQGRGLGGQVFPQMQIKIFPRLERYDVEFEPRQGRARSPTLPLSPGSA